MPATVDEVKKMMQDEFPNSDVSDIREGEYHRVTGTIRWYGFKGKELDERYNLLLRARNKLEDRGIKVGFLLPLAPGEQP